MERKFCIIITFFPLYKIEHLIRELGIAKRVPISRHPATIMSTAHLLFKPKQRITDNVKPAARRSN